MRIFLDTNVLLDFVCRRGEFYPAALEVFEHVYMGKCEGCLSALSYITACYVAKAYKISQDEMATALNDIREATTSVALTDEIVANALASDWSDKEDAAQHLSAKAVGADCILTRNVKDFALSDISVLTPQQFVEQYLQTEVAPE